VASDRPATISVNGDAHFFKLVENWCQGIAIRQGEKFVFVNQALAEMYGYETPAEIMSLDSSLLLHPESERDRISQIYATHTEGMDSPACYELQAVRKDGSLWWAEYRNQEIAWNGTPAVMIALGDITERKRIEEPPEVSEKRTKPEQNLQAILDSSLVGISVIDPKTNERLYVNPRYLELMGAASNEELASRDLVETFVDPQDFIRLSEQLDAGEAFAETEVARKRLDGSRWWCLLSSTIADYEGQQSHIVWHYDISNIKEHEREIVRQRSVLQSILENMDQGVMLFDENLDALAFNQKFLDIMNVPKRQFEPGANFATFIRFYAERGEYGPGDVEEQVRQKVELERKFEAHQFERKTLDGKIVEIRSQPVSGSGFLTMYSDVTERKRSEEELRESEQRLVSILRDCPIGVAIVRASDSHISFANSRLCDLLEIKESKLVGSHVGSYYVDPGERRAMLARFDQDGFFYDHEIEVKRTDGTPFWSAVSILPMEHEGGPARLTWYYDISKLKSAEADLEQQSSLLSDVLDTLFQGVIKYDRDRKVMIRNRQTSEILNVPAALIEVGRPIVDLVRFLAERGDYGDSDPETQVEQRLQILWSGESSRREATFGAGRTFDVAVQPTSDGGLVITYTDITELKRAAEKINQQSQLLSQVLNTVIQGVVKYDSDRKLAIWNQHFQDMLGLPDELMQVGRPSVEIARCLAERGDYGEGESETVVEQRLQAMWSGKASRMEATLGDGRIFDFASQPTSDGGLVITYTDITERKRAEEEIRASQQNLEAILENSPMGVTINAIETIERLYINRRFMEQMGVESEDELDVKRTEETLVDPEDIQRMAVLFASDDPIVSTEVLRRRRDGTQWWCMTVRTRIHYSGVDAYLNWHVDITERKLAEDELHSSKALLDGIVENCGLYIYVKDREGRYRLGNRPWEELTGFSRSKAVGKTDFDIFPKSIAEQYRDNDKLVMANSEVKQSEEGGIRDGESITMLSQKFPLYAADGELEGLCGISTDITERKQAEADIMRAKEAAEEATKAKATFLATMSHEIRTPMNGVIGMADLLAQTELVGDQRQMLNTIRDSGGSLLTIINDILDFSKIEAGKLEIEEIAMSVTDVVEGAAATLGVNAANKGLRLITHVDPRLPPFVLGDSVRVRQIMFNLIGNAIKFTETGEVVARADLVENGGLQVRFSIIDQGIGISEEGQAKLFQAFSQAETSTTRKFGGTGLGLTICLRLAELMGGEIGVESVLGEGSTFHVTLPFAVAEGGRSEAREFDLSGLEVLVASSSEAERGACEAVLAEAGAEVQSEVAVPTDPTSDVVVLAEAGDGDAALALADRLDGSGPRLVLARIRRAEEGPLGALEDVVFVDANPIRSAGLLRAVAVAAGRASPEIDYEADVEALPKRAAPTPDEALARGELILLAEDNVTNQDVIRRQLAVLGYACEIADDGALALEAWRTKAYALLLTDCHMPNMDGFELTAAIRGDEIDRTERARIVAITANALEGEAERCIAAGMDDYLSKPVAMPALKATLEKWMPVGSGGEALAAEPAAATLTDADAVVDPAFLCDSFGDDAELIAEILGDYVEPALEIVAEIDAAYAAHSAADITAAAHKLKSASRAIGADSLADLCESLEAAGKADDWDTIEADYPALAAAVEAVKAHIEAL
jgi:PAS domain S-box-containing protein